jgi:RNA polymerase sigma-70 factor (ECF subfamily)
MFDATTFAELLQRVRTGDQVAAAELVQQYEPLIRREVRLRLEDQRLRRTLDSMDICQSVLASFFVRTAVGEYDLQEPQQLIRLLVTMTRHKVASAARRQYRQKRDSRRLQTDDSQVLAGVAKEELTPSGIVVGEELLQRARGLLRGEEGQIAELRGQGQTWDEIAQQLGGTAQSRRVQFARAVARVSQELGLSEEPSE